MSTMILDIPATLHLNTWAGHRTYRIRVTGETRENFRFEALEDIPMPRQRWLKTGEHGRAPKDAVTVPNASGNGQAGVLACPVDRRVSRGGAE